jgi:hypothetical protein
LFDLIDELAALRGASRASVVVDFLEAAEPTMRNLLVSLRAFMSAQKESQDQFLLNLEEAERTLAPIVAAALDGIETGVREGAQPPHSNTGVTPSTENPSEGRSRAPEPSDHKGSRGNRRGASHGGKGRGSRG